MIVELIEEIWTLSIAKHLLGRVKLRTHSALFLLLNTFYGLTILTLGLSEIPRVQMVAMIIRRLVTIVNEYGPR
jgi:hypothetical protein